MIRFCFCQYMFNNQWQLHPKGNTNKQTNKIFHKFSLKESKKVRAEECYSLWRRPMWHVKVITRIANHTLVSSFWALPVSCLFAFFYPLQKLPVRTHNHTQTHFPAQMWQKIFSMRHKESGWTKISLSPTPFILFTFTMSAFDTNKPAGICSITMKNL